MMQIRGSRDSRGQAMVEMALVLPLFLMVLMGIIILGIGVFYQQQVTNAAREAARYASTHSGTAQCATASHLDPRSGKVDPVSGRASAGLAPDYYYPCDTPQLGWPNMTASARSLIFGLNPQVLKVGACWSGYVTATQYDAPPPDAVQPPSPSTWAQCLIDGQDPTNSPRTCSPGLTSGCIRCTDGIASTTVDMASDISDGPGRIVGNTVTAYACYLWSPPLAGFLLIPSVIPLQAAITEPIERQQ